MSTDIQNPLSPFPKSTAALMLHGLTLLTFFAASAAPTPLYRIYQQDWGFSPATLTVIFGVYAFGLLLALLFTGSLSDHLGRRPVIFLSLIGQALALVLFIAARDAGTLIAARLMQGIATGIATSALGAALVDSNRNHGAIVNSIAPLVGLAAGALGSSVLVQFAPMPMRIIYIALLTLVVLLSALLWLVPETVSRVPGALASLRPKIHLPKQARAAFIMVTPINISIWALGGFYLSLVPSLVSAATGDTAPLIGGSVVATLTLAGALMVYLLRAKPAVLPLTIGPVAKAIGIAILLSGVHTGVVALMFVGTAIAGAGFGSSFLGTVKTIMPLAKAHERAGLLATLYIQSYLAFSLPAILAGFLAQAIGLKATTDVYGLVIICLTLGGLCAMNVVARRSRARA